MSAEVFDGYVDVNFYAEERAAVADAVPVRRREDPTVRRCGRTALGEPGISLFLLPPGPHTTPRPPAEEVGGTTHCSGYRAPARARRPRSLGVDVEESAPLPAGNPIPRLTGRRWTHRYGAVPTAIALPLSVNESPARASHTRAPSRASLGTENR
ncbi:hypothetical protein [Streptomyces sp. HB132]|uniref:hypothetical protein n=1 Tax=Streptomyces sp. HB132 TaxID=767388 RepID=UPI0035A8E8C2